MLGQLLRIKQWYKNLVIYFPLIFSHDLGNIPGIFMTTLGFLSLCLVSSSGYIINDIWDRKNDLYHPEKKNRPIALGLISVRNALLIAMVLLGVSLTLAAYLNKYFLLFVIGIFVLSQAYSLFLKKELFADIIVISSIFVVRAVSGSFVGLVGSKPYIAVSPWLIIGPFFLALFLAAGKRHADLLSLQKEAKNHKQVLGLYTQEMTLSISYMSATLLIASYSLYSFLSVNPQLIYTLPFAVYSILRYLQLVKEGNIIGRHPEKAWKDIRFLVSLMIWFLMIILLTI